MRTIRIEINGGSKEDLFESTSLVGGKEPWNYATDNLGIDYPQ